MSRCNPNDIRETPCGGKCKGVLTYSCYEPARNGYEKICKTCKYTTPFTEELHAKLDRHVSATSTGLQSIIEMLNDAKKNNQEIKTAMEATQMKNNELDVKMTMISEAMSKVMAEKAEQTELIKSIGTLLQKQSEELAGLKSTMSNMTEEQAQIFTRIKEREEEISEQKQKLLSPEEPQVSESKQDSSEEETSRTISSSNSSAPSPKRQENRGRPKKEVEVFTQAYVKSLDLETLTSMVNSHKTTSNKYKREKDPRYENMYKNRLLLETELKRRQ